MPGVVVEGPDGSGKTTLIKKLRNEFKWPVVHVVQPGVPNIPQMVRLVNCAPVIFDRFHLSEVAYGNVLRDGSKLDWHDLWALEGLLVARGFVLITCISDVNAMLVNNRNEEQLFDEVRQEVTMLSLVNQYRRIMKESLLTSIQYDFLHNHVDEALEFVKSNTVDVAPTGVIGAPRPDIWLVGDERNLDAGYRPYYNVPFYWPGGGHKLTCATLVGKMMAELGLTWRNTALSNSERGSGVLCKWYEELNGPRVVAMGGKASQRLREAGIEHRSVQHPQYIRRFRYSAAVEIMAQQVREAIG